MKSMLSRVISVAATALTLTLAPSPALAFSTTSIQARWTNGPTTVARPETEKEQKIGSSDNEFMINSESAQASGPLEYNIDDTNMERDMAAPFHILLLDETFHQNTRITIDYVASSCCYVLSMPYDEAAELAAFAEDQGFSCLGTWPRAECLRLGEQLQQRDLVVRVVPFVEGGKRGWQSRDANPDNDANVVRKEGAGSSGGDGSDDSSWGFQWE